MKKNIVAAIAAILLILAGVNYLRAGIITVDPRCDALEIWANVPIIITINGQEFTEQQFFFWGDLGVEVGEMLSFTIEVEGKEVIPHEVTRPDECEYIPPYPGQETPTPYPDPYPGSTVPPPTMTPTPTPIYVYLPEIQR